MNLSIETQTIIDKIHSETKPISIFIYCSRARNDWQKESDYEIGIIYDKNHYVQRKDLADFHQLKYLNLFPFLYEDFIDLKLDTPFPKSIYLRDLILSAMTIKGKAVVEKLFPPPIRLTDLLEGISFQLGYALAATHSYKQGDLVTSASHFVKSFMNGLKILVIVKKGKFPLTFNEIVDGGKSLLPPGEIRSLVTQVIKVRGGQRPDLNTLFLNISFLNTIVSKNIKTELQKSDRIVIP